MSFVEAAELFDLEKMKTLLEQGKGAIDEKNAFGDTALHICIGRKDFVHFLLDKGASPNARNNIGSTPLHKAAALNDKFIVNPLLKHKADPNIRNTAGFFPESYASRQDVVTTILGGNIKQISVAVNTNAGLVIGKKGATLKKLKSESGAYIDVPKSAGEPHAVIIGREENAVAAKNLILNILYPNRGQNQNDDDDSHKTMVRCPISKQKHGLIVGKGGSTLKKLQKEFNVTIKMPNSGETDSNVIRVFGEIDNIQNAVARIHQLTANRNKDERGQQGGQQKRTNSNKRTPSANSKPVPKKTTNALPVIR